MENSELKILVIGIINYQVYLNRNEIERRKINKDSVYATVINYLLKNRAIERAFAVDDVSNTTLITKIKESVSNNYYPSRSGDIQLVYKPQWIDGFLTRALLMASGILTMLTFHSSGTDGIFHRGIHTRNRI